MANDGKIYITISDRRFGQNKAEADEQNKIDQSKEQNSFDEAGKFAQHQFRSFISSQMKQAVAYSLNNIGNFSGDYEKQAHVSTAITVFSDLNNVGMAAIAGAKTAGGLGALIGALIVTASTVVSYSTQYFDMQQSTKKQNLELSRLRTRAGLNGTNNGSRGTEN